MYPEHRRRFPNVKSRNRRPRSRAKAPLFTNDDLWGYAFIGVAVIFFLMFTIYPLISAVITSLEDYKPFGSDFVGLKNYQTTFTNALFWKSLKNTLVYTAVVVPLSLLISFRWPSLSCPLKRSCSLSLRPCTTCPPLPPASRFGGVAVDLRFLALRPVQPAAHLLFHLPTQNWLGSSKTSMLSLMIMALLSGQGQNIIIYTAALLGIDNTYFEAAELDGATFMQKVTRIVFPLVKPTTLFLLVTFGVIGSFPGVPERLHDDRRRPDNATTDDRPADLQQRLYLILSMALPAHRQSSLPSSLRLSPFLQFKMAGSDVEY